MKKFRIIYDNQNVVVEAEDIFDAIIIFDVDNLKGIKRLTVKELED